MGWSGGSAYCKSGYQDRSIAEGQPIQDLGKGYGCMAMGANIHSINETTTPVEVVAKEDSCTFMKRGLTRKQPYMAIVSGRRGTALFPERRKQLT